MTYLSCILVLLSAYRGEAYKKQADVSCGAPESSGTAETRYSEGRSVGEG